MWDCWSTVIYCQHACRPRSRDRGSFGAYKEQTGGQNQRHTYHMNENICRIVMVSPVLYLTLANV